MKFLLVCAVLAATLLAVRFFSAAEAKVDTAPHPPVIVELFTSEGCSSCPPADRLLLDLQKQSRPDAPIIVLSQHVDYWDGLGWKDPFSARQFSDRQAQYAQLQIASEVYTPQMFVDGHRGFTGSDTARAVDEIRDAAKATKTEIHIEQLDSATDSTKLRFTTQAGKESDLILAITEDGLETKVARGENRGRYLAHTGVVRLMKKVGATNGNATSLDTVVSLDPSWKRARLRAVAFLQRPSGLIVGAASIDLR